MKYEWIELYGYAGIYNGMGINQIKIDFTKCKTNKIIIKGSNGSGKSTLINAISLLKDSNNNFINNMEARKNVCVNDNGIIYIIRYIHPLNNNGERGTTKGYISKLINGTMVELNPNGNISSCEDIIYEEFKLDSNFSTLTKLSSEDRGLVEKKPAERKKFVNTIINTLEVFNEIYKKINKKSSDLKRLINSLTNRINYIGNETPLTAKLENINNRLNSLENEKNMTIEAISSVNIKISDYMDILKNNNYDTIVSNLKDISSHNKITRNQIINKSRDLGIDDINKLDSFFIYLDKQIAIYENDIETLSKQSLSLLSQREAESNDLQNKTTKLNSLQSEYNYIDIKNALKSTKAKLSEYEDIFNKMGLMNINLITKEEFNSAMDSLKYLRDMAFNITSTWNIEDIRYVINNLTLISSEISKLIEYNNELIVLKNDKSNIDKQITIFESKKDLINELNNRPKNCSIDDCPYIKSALEASANYPESKLISLVNKSKELELLIKDKEDYISKLNTYKDINIAILSIIRELNSKINFINKLPVTRNFKESFLQRICNLDQFNDINNLYKYVDCGNMIEEYKILKEQFEKYNSEYELYKAKNDIIESILKDIELLTKKTDELAIKIDEINTEKLNKQNKLNELLLARDKLNNLIIKYKEDLIPSENKEKELIRIKETLDKNSKEIEKLQGELSVLNSNLGAVNSDIKNLTNEKNKIEQSLSLLASYKSELNVYMESYNKIEKIKYYSSPTSGIQTIFMELYMNNIIYNANQLLSLLFEGEFVLQPFIINESEFRIPCIGSGLMHYDISSMSTAQKSMISMILSFSILNQSSSKYNIIMLDEIDGGLDTVNRGLFIDLIDKLMMMLKCEQCFMISHNNEINTASCDLIVLKNNSNEVYTGNIIWQY